MKPKYTKYILPFIFSSFLNSRLNTGEVIYRAYMYAVRAETNSYFHSLICNYFLHESMNLSAKCQKIVKRFLDRFLDSVLKFVVLLDQQSKTPKYFFSNSRRQIKPVNPHTGETGIR